METMAIRSNSDFLFLYEASKCNPNGDPDMENKPRIDYETKTNLVTDLRLKRFIRDYLKQLGYPIFVDTISDKKVTADYMLNSIIKQNLNRHDSLLQTNAEMQQLWDDLTRDLKSEEKNYEHVKQLKGKKKDENWTRFNNLFLNMLIKTALIDIRFFGGAFAIEGFSETYTGPVQINWGYSLHPVELIKSNTITTKFSSKEEAGMGSMGKDYRLYYSLLAFHGTINKNAATKSGLTDADVALFREAIIQAIPAQPTRSKLGQYPLLFLQLEYQAGYHGFLRDLRDFIQVKYAPEKAIRCFNDLDLSFEALKNLIRTNQNKIAKVYFWESELTDKKFVMQIIPENITVEILEMTVAREDK